eukprot:104893_1
MEKGMEDACAKFNFSGSNAFTGDPLTATKGPWFVKNPKCQGFCEGSKDASKASFAAGVGLLGRAKANGFDSCPNVQSLPGDKFLRLDLAKEYGVKGVCAVFVPKFDAVIEFYTDQERSDFDKDGILACF